MVLRKIGARIGASTIAIIAAAQLLAGTYNNFVVQGNERIASTVILSMAGLAQGQLHNDEDINQALQRLYASGLFADVQLLPQGNTILVKIVENGTISRVYFEGNKKFKDEQLAQIINIGPRDGLDRARIEEEAQNIRRFYAARSRFNAEVRPVVIPLGNGLNKVIFEIDEGTTSEVQRVTFTGNQSVSDWRLRRTINTGETSVFTTIFSRDDFATEKLLSDEAQLENYYRENGYYNAEVKAVSADYNEGGDYFLSYAIKEGRQYHFGKVNLTSEISGVNAQQYAHMIKSKSGKIYKASNVRKTIEAIEVQAAFDGLPFLRAVPEIVPNEANGTLDVVYKLVQDNRNYVERIDIHGNETTIDRVIRRQFEIVEGDPVNSRKINEARQRIEGLGFFAKTQVRVREGTHPDQKIIDVEVEEAPTGSLSFGGAYSNENGFSVNANLSERNFLGRGQYVSLFADVGQKAQSASFSFAEPGLFERNLTGGFDLYFRNKDREASKFQTTNYGFEPYVSFPLTENSRLRLGYFARSNEIRDVIDETSPLIKAEEGRVVTSGVSATWTWDRLNSGKRPTRGWIMRLGGKYAGIGGDANWYQLGGKAKVYYSFFHDDVVVSAEIEGGRISSLNDDPVRITERYFLGGDNLLGFRTDGIGPRDKTDDINSTLGGNNYASVRTEITFPVGLPEELGVRGGFFWNAGSVWGLDNVTGGASGTIDDDLYVRGAYGASIFWDLGGQSLRFSWSNAYQKEDYDEVQEFSVSLAARF